MFKLFRKARARSQLEFVPIGHTNERVVFDMGELKTKVMPA